MRDSSFFQGIERAHIHWGEHVIPVPVFYYDSMKLDAAFPASYDGLKALLPSARRMHPIQVSPGQGVVIISTMEFRDNDLGPYNEVSINIPFTLDEATPPSAGILAEVPNFWVHRLPVSTEIARATGAEFGGYPKFLASIEFERQDNWVVCHLAEGDQHILTLAGRHYDELQEAPRARANYFTTRGGRILRSEAIARKRLQAISADPSDVQLDLGDHPVSEELKGLGLDGLLVYQYTPSYQGILGPVVESLEA